MTSWLARALGLAVTVSVVTGCTSLLGIKYLSNDEVGDGGAEDGGADATTDSPDASDATRADASGRDGGGTGLDATTHAEAGAPDAANEPGDAASDGPCTNACTAGEARCASGSVETCTLVGSCTQWVSTATCGPHQMCAATASSASCTCDASPCTQQGKVCQDAQTVATCATDTNGCLYVASTTPCTMPQGCSGMAPGAACSLTCSSSCTQGQTACVSGGLATCALGSNSCYAYAAPVACAAHQSCTGTAGVGKCTCNTDSVCRTAANTCVNATTLATCSLDGQGCIYEASSSTCTNGACSGGACCTNACTYGAVQCPSNSSTQLQYCSVAANGCTAWTSSGCSTGLVCERYGGAACVDPNWTEWPAPNTLGYMDNGNGTVTDNVTALVWQQTVPSGTYTESQAAMYCASLNLAGYTDWRLPSTVELISIVDTGSYNPSINSTYFPATPFSNFWSSTKFVQTSAAAYTGYWVTFAYGGAMYADVTTANYVRCVR